MPCRAGSLCRQASQSFWITDDVLADAFNRFARVSNAHRRKTEGRRYGSHVPGPLEAHRRSNKRRMGVQAVASSMPPSGVDLGSLFGLGGYTSERRVDDWKWQPPGEQKHQKRERWPFASKSKTKTEAWDAFLEIPEASPGEDVEKSKHAFEDLLAKSENVEDLFDFLRTTGNEPEARNTLRVTEWLSKKRCNGNDLRALETLLKEKIRLQTLADGELVSIITLILHWDTASGQVAGIAGLLDEVASEGELVLACSSVTLALLGDMQADRRLSPQLELWLRILRATSCLRGDHFHSPVWTRVYDLLARGFSDFTALKDHLSTLKRLDLSRVILKHWVLSDGAVTSTDMTITTAGSCKRLARAGHGPPHVTRLLEDFEHLASRYATRRERASGFTSLAQVVALLHRHGIPHVKLCRGIFDILMQSASAGSVYRIFYGITHHAGVGIDQELASNLIQYFLSMKQVGYATQVFHAVPALPLSACYELPITLAKEYPCSAARIWSILKRLTPEDRFVRTGEMRNRLPPDHVDLIHLIAFQFANSPRMTPRSAFRRVWECYIFLRDRMAYMRPMMSRAFVTAGIVRPMRNLQRVSTVKFRYVLRLVERFEGRDVAEDLDRLVWKTWNESILPRIRARKISHGLDEALDPNMDGLRDAHAVRARLITATRSFRKGRMWLFPERLQQRTDAQLQDAASSYPVNDPVHIVDAMKAAELAQITASDQASGREMEIEPTAATGPLEDPTNIETHPDATVKTQIQHHHHVVQHDLQPVSFPTLDTPSSPTDRSGPGHDSYQPFGADDQVGVRAEQEVSSSSSPDDTHRSQPTTPPSIERLGLNYDGMALSRPEKELDMEQTASALPELAPEMLVSVASEVVKHTPEIESFNEGEIKHRRHIFEDKGLRLDHTVAYPDTEWKHRTTKHLSIHNDSIQWQSEALESPHKKAHTHKPSPNLGLSPLELLEHESQVVAHSRTSETEEVARRETTRAETQTQQNLKALPAQAERQPTTKIVDKQLTMKPLGSRTNQFPRHRPLSEVELRDLRALEMQCWGKSVFLVGDLDTLSPDFLRWRRVDDGRHCLFMEWRGSWRRVAKVWTHLLLYREAGSARLAEELGQRFDELAVARAEFEDNNIGGPLRGPDGKTVPVRGSHTITRLEDRAECEMHAGIEARSDQVVNLHLFNRKKEKKTSGARFFTVEELEEREQQRARKSRLLRELDIQEVGKRDWQAFSNEWWKRRKKHGYDPLTGRFKGE